MSDSPIFDQLFRERSCGKTYDQFFKFSASSPWSGSSKGVKLGKPYTIAKAFSMELPASVQKPSMIEVWKPTPDSAEDFSDLLDAYKGEIRQGFAEAHPDAVITKVEVKPNLDNNTLSLVVEGLHPTVKPLSARDTAQPME